MPIDNSTRFPKPLAADLRELSEGMAIVIDGDTAPKAIASGQYLFIKNHSTLATGGYHATAAIAKDADITSSNVTPDADGIVNGAVSALSEQIGTLNSNFEYHVGDTIFNPDWTPFVANTKATDNVIAISVPLCKPLGSDIQTITATTVYGRICTANGAFENTTHYTTRAGTTVNVINTGTNVLCVEITFNSSTGLGAYKPLAFTGGIGIVFS